MQEPAQNAANRRGSLFATLLQRHNSLAKTILKYPFPACDNWIQSFLLAAKFLRHYQLEQSVTMGAQESKVVIDTLFKAHSEAQNQGKEYIDLEVKGQVRYSPVAPDGIDWQH